MRKVNLNILVAVCVFLMTLTGSVGADTHYVSPGQSIQAAINAASNGDEICVLSGTYIEAINFNGKAVRLYSSGGPYATTIDANGAYHVVQCVSGEGANTILDGFTITGGNANGTSWPDNCGGGMLNYQSSPTVTNCNFSGNTATCGGGMQNYYSSPTVTNCIIGGNKAGTSGGGMQNSDSNPTVTNCTFIDNEVDSYGGGVLNDTDSYPSFVNCIFTGNVSGTYSGGMGNSLSSPTLTNCTFSDNKANAIGGGILNYDNCNPVVTNCILWGNSPNQIVDWSGTGCSTTVTYSDVQDGWGGSGGNNIAADPLFVNAAGSDLRLSSSSSPCVDTGDNSAAGLPATDLAGNPRVLDGDSNGTVIVDMGAYEYIETLRLVAHWKLDEYYGPTAHDSAGKNHGTLQGGPFWLPTWGKVGGALQLDGVNDYVDCGNYDILNITGQITLALWVNTNDSGNGQYNSYITKGDHSYGLQHKYNNNVEFFFSDGVNWYWVRYPVNSSFNGVWHHLAGTYDGNDLKLYVDGELKAGSSHTGSIGGSAYNVNIGGNSEATDRFYKGLIDDVSIYNYALSADEILQLLCTRQINEDLDGNCKVDFRDLALLVSEWLTCNLPSYEMCWEQ